MTFAWRPGSQYDVPATRGADSVLASDCRAQFGRPSTRRGCRICVTVRLPFRQRRETMYWQANANTPLSVTSPFKGALSSFDDSNGAPTHVFGNGSWRENSCFMGKREENCKNSPWVGVRFWMGPHWVGHWALVDRIERRFCGQKTIPNKILVVACRETEIR